MSRFLLCICTVVILIAGLWPFRLHPPNLVRHDKDAGLVFGQRGIAYATDIVWPSDEFSFEISLRSAGPIRGRVGHIACISQNKVGSEFCIEQWKSRAILTAILCNAARDTIESVGIPDALPGGEWRDLLVTSGPHGTRVYVDGQLKDRRSGRIAIKDANRLLVLGNDALGVEAWEGSIAGLAIYDRELDSNEIRTQFQTWTPGGPPPQAPQGAAWFDFTGQTPLSLSTDHPRPNTVFVPMSFVPPRRAMLSWDFKLNRSGVSDIVLNIVGFVPFGLLLCIILCKRRGRRSAFVLTLTIGTALSAAIEITQAFMPGRDSSSVDLLNNSLGTAAGAFVAMLYVGSRLRQRLATSRCSS